MSKTQSGCGAWAHGATMRRPAPNTLEIPLAAELHVLRDDGIVGPGVISQPAS
jgi:hypothetical protein